MEELKVYTIGETDTVIALNPEDAKAVLKETTGYEFEEGIDTVVEVDPDTRLKFDLSSIGDTGDVEMSARSWLSFVDRRGFLMTTEW